MCGIVGAISLSEGGLPWTQGDILQAARILRHRGPDAQTSWADPSGNCLLGHARLRVIDLEAGGQPMGSEDNSIHVVFNGEIYNFRELRKDLERKGFRFVTQSDTETLVHGWRAWREGLPERLDGMFAFAVWDRRRQSLFLARDRCGKKPLFLFRGDGVLAFASEIKALLALPGVDPTIDPTAFPHYLAYGYVPSPKTFYRQVTKLPPAHTLLVDGGGEPEIKRYWAPVFHPVPIERPEALERTRILVRQAVKKRMVADVPLGALLSGGVDSTIVTGLMAELQGAPIRTFSAGFADDPTYDETRWAHLVSERFGTEHTQFRVEADSVDLVSDLVGNYDEPFGDSSAIPTWLVSQRTRQSVTVALGGDGGDEVFAGYQRFLAMSLAERTPSLLLRFGNLLGKRLPHHSNFRHPTRRFSRFFRAAALPPDERWLRLVGFFAGDPFGFLRAEVRPEVEAEMAEEGEVREVLLRSFREPLEEASGASALGRALALNFHTYLPEDLLVKADRNSMAHGLELRSPFLDTALVEFAASLPDEIRTPGWRLKGLLKDAFSDLIPREIRNRPKMGFGVPLPLWFRTHWRPFLEDTVLSPDARVRAWLKPEPLRALAEEHWSGKRDRGHELWALLTLELWLRTRGEA